MSVTRDPICGVVLAMNAFASPWAGARSTRRPFAEVAEEHLDDVRRFLVFFTGDAGLADDLTAETFERALRRWKRYDPRRGPELPWLCAVARRVALDHFRSESRRRGREQRYAAEESQSRIWSRSASRPSWRPRWRR